MEAFYGILIPFLGTSLGAACVFFMKKTLSDRVQRSLTGFAAGVMVAASVWSLLIPAIEQSAAMGTWAFVPAAAGFWIGVLFLLALDHLIPHLHANSASAEGPKSRLQRTTMMVLAVTLHNIPEGMAVSTPLIYGGTHPAKAAGIAAASGLPTVLGAIAGYFIGALNPLMLSLCLAFAGGAMLYVVFAELMPDAFCLLEGKIPAFSMLVGILAGLLLVCL